jgi:hypothetical protein
MRKSYNALVGFLALLSASGPMTAVPTEAAETYVPNAYKAMPARLFSYPYGGTYLRVDYARRRFGYPYVGFYYGNYYAPDYDPFYPSYYGYSSSCYRSRRC